MNKGLRPLLLGCAALALVPAVPGCTGRHPAGTASLRAVSPVVPADPKAALTIDQIEPAVALPPPTTQPAVDPPLDAILLYARARAALLGNQQFEGIGLLERASKLDPYSFDVFYDLGRAYLSTGAGGTANERAIAAMEKAAALRPDSLELQYELGRQHLNRNDNDRALARFRLARLTTDYRSAEKSDTSAMLDFFLARSLRQAGYTGAALGQYDSLLGRLSSSSLSAHSSPELLYFVRHPQILYTEMGELYDKLGAYADALHAYKLALQADPESAEMAARVVRTALNAGDAADAKSRAAALVARGHGTGDALDLLKEVHARLGQPDGYGAALAKLHADQPADRLIFYALLAELTARGRAADGERLLLAATRGSNSDPDYTRRLFALYQARNDTEAAMRLLVDSLADRPDSLREIGPLWGELVKPARHGKLRLQTLQQMKVPEREEAARLFWVSRLAETWSRDALARSTLRKAAELKPPFAPVHRWLVNEIWAKPDLDEAQKAQACEDLAASVEGQGDAALAAELRGRSLLFQDDAGAAAKSFAAAQALGNKSPDLQLIHAEAIARDNEPRAEVLLWRLLSDWPQYEEAYLDLFNLGVKQQAWDKARSVVRKWVDAIPSSVLARVYAAEIEAGSGRPDAVPAARGILDALFDEQPQNADVLQAIAGFCRRHGQLDGFVTKLESERTKNPDNRAAVEVLVAIYAADNRLPEAARVLDDAKAAVAKDPDLLYYVAHLYERIEQKETTEQLLVEVVRLDPKHAAASNDLGYTWADEGKNLDRAEALVRVAVEAEPDNQSYLDSMAWVEYKRGKFAEARSFLDRAIGPANRPDPVVLDHLGDVLYRLNQPQEAVKQWNRSLKRLDETGVARDDLKQLRQLLLTKLEQQKSGRPVNVAPVAEMPSKPTQAKN